MFTPYSVNETILMMQPFSGYASYEVASSCEAVSFYEAALFVNAPILTRQPIVSGQGGMFTWKVGRGRITWFVVF